MGSNNWILPFAAGALVMHAAIHLMHFDPELPYGLAGEADYEDDSYDDDY